MWSLVPSEAPELAQIFGQFLLGVVAHAVFDCA